MIGIRGGNKEEEVSGCSCTESENVYSEKEGGREGGGGGGVWGEGGRKHIADRFHTLQTFRRFENQFRHIVMVLFRRIFQSHPTIHAHP